MTEFRYIDLYSAIDADTKIDDRQPESSESVANTIVAGEPEALVEFFLKAGFDVSRIGLEVVHCRNGCMTA